MADDHPPLGRQKRPICHMCPSGIESRVHRLGTQNIDKEHMISPLRLRLWLSCSLDNTHLLKPDSSAILNGTLCIHMTYSQYNIGGQSLV